MTDTGKRKNRIETVAKVVSLIIVSVVGILLLILICIKMYLATDLPAPQLSRFVTSYLHQSFTVQSLHTSGATLILKGVRLQNPAGFPPEDLAAADSIAIAPRWGDLLLGRQRFRLVGLEGIKVNLDKNSSGIWNFAQLQQRLFAGKKPSPKETSVGELSIKNGAIKVQGQGVQGIALQIFNLTTKGSAESKVDLAFEDAARNRYTLKGKARSGSDAALDLALTAPALSLKDVAILFKLKSPNFFEGSKGTLLVNASMHKGELSTSGDFSFRQVRLPSAGKNYPVNGRLHFEGNYSTQSDTARLQATTLTVNNLVKLRAQGMVRGLKGERDFTLDLGMDEADLATINVIVPEQVRKQMLFGGRLRCDSLHLEGNGSEGLKSATGSLQLHDGALTREGRLIVSGLTGTIGLSRKDAGILAKGKLSTAGSNDKALLQALDMPFGLAVLPRMKPVSAEIPALSAVLMGIPVTGRVAFDAARANPLTASLKVPAAKLSAINSVLQKYDLNLKSGTASLMLEVAGKSAQELSATAKVLLSDVHGTRGKDVFAVKKGTIAAKVQRTGGHLLAQGDMQLSAMALNGKAADARSGYRLADGVVYLDGAHVSFGGAQVSVSHLSGRIPTKQSIAGIARYPIELDIDGADIKQGEMEIRKLSGRMRGNFNADGAGRWLDGTAGLDAGAVFWQGKPVGAPAVHLSFFRSGGRGELSGQLLGGKLAGAVLLNPFAPEPGGTFDAGVTGAGLAAAAPFLPKSTGVSPAGGLVDLHLKGGYSSRDGLTCRFDSKGSGIVLTGGGGKALVSGAALSLSGAMAGGNLSISEAVLAPAKGVALKLKGELAQVFSPKRKGSITFSLPEAALTGIVDPFINVLPRIMQEATVDGTVAAEGKIDLADGKKLVEGALIFKGVRIEVESQKLVVADINGRFPFSLGASGNPGGKTRTTMAFSKENYPRLLEQLSRSGADGGQVITIGKIAFGALELGKVTMHVSAGNGSTDIISLKSSFYEGALLGGGYVTMPEKLAYRGDLLINGLSMKALCSTIPDLKGYISGRVDGVISLSGAGSGLAGITGFTDLWAREDKGEKMLVSKDFLQRLSKQKLSGFFFRNDRKFDEAEIKAMLEEGDLTFDTLKIVHTNPFGVRDLNVSIAQTQNRIALDHLLESIKEAAVRGKATAGEQPGQPGEPAQPGQPAGAPVTPEFKWGE